MRVARKTCPENEFDGWYGYGEPVLSEVGSKWKLLFDIETPTRQLPIDGPEEQAASTACGRFPSGQTDSFEPGEWFVGGSGGGAPSRARVALNPSSPRVVVAVVVVRATRNP